MTSLPKGMTSEEASLKKVSGHINEHDYAKLIGGAVNTTGQGRKKDVLDTLGCHHSVKSGKKWQIFLYSKSRLQSDTMLQGMGHIADHLIDCINSLPASRGLRQANPAAAKAALAPHMRALAHELQDPRLLQAFFMKAAFEAGEVDYWALLPPEIDQTKARIEEKLFHVFSAKEAVAVMCDTMVVGNSKAQGKGQTDDQKVVFRNNSQIGEIELRTDPQNWGRVKMWLDSRRVLDLLRSRIPVMDNPVPQITTYGAVRKIT